MEYEGIKPHKRKRDKRKTVRVGGGTKKGEMRIKGNEGEGNNKGNSTQTECEGGTKSEEITDKEKE